MGEIIATIIVSWSSSKCSRCQLPTLVVDQRAHDRVVGYGWEGQPGCGAVFTAITTDELG